MIRDYSMSISYTLSSLSIIFRGEQFILISLVKFHSLVLFDIVKL